MTLDVDLLAAFSVEVERKAHEPPMELVCHSLTVLQIAGALQLASRHPNFPPSHAAAVDRFLTAARGYFADCPAVLQVLRRGDDPSEDRS